MARDRDLSLTSSLSHMVREQHLESHHLQGDKRCVLDSWPILLFPRTVTAGLSKEQSHLIQRTEVFSVFSPNPGRQGADILDVLCTCTVVSSY